MEFERGNVTAYVVEEYSVSHLNNQLEQLAVIRIPYLIPQSHL